jgi:hypothetical protein
MPPSPFFAPGGLLPGSWGALPLTCDSFYSARPVHKLGARYMYAPLYSWRFSPHVSPILYPYSTWDVLPST